MIEEVIIFVNVNTRHAKLAALSKAASSSLRFIS
jgi:hypothetical protein